MSLGWVLCVLAGWDASTIEHISDSSTVCGRAARVSNPHLYRPRDVLQQVWDSSIRHI